MAPYLEIADFETQFKGTLTAGETAVATRLLQVVSDWIRDRKPDADEDAAAQVVFEVVRDALTYGDMERFRKYTNTSAHRTESAEFDEAFSAVADDYLTKRHKRLLGIAVSVAGRGRFKKCDY